MKKIWKIRKDGKAVSPVIATILMVAITVVLAAVLYVMVMGFGGPSTQTPTGSFTMASKISATTEKVQFGVITPDTTPINVKIVINKNGAAFASGVLPSASGGVLTGGTGSSANVTYTSLVGGTPAKIGSGDYITITIGGSAATYEVSMIFIPTGNIIGATYTINWA